MRRTVVWLRRTGHQLARLRPWLPGWLGLWAAFSAMAQPDAVGLDAVGLDSLLRLSPTRRYVVVKEAYHQVLSKDTTAGKRLRRELEAFFKEKATDNDRLLLQMALLDAERHNRFHTRRILPRATALLRRAEADRDTVLMALAHLNIGQYYYGDEVNHYLAFRHYGLAFPILRHRTDADFPERDNSVYMLAFASYAFFDYPRAIELGRELHPSGPGPRHRNHIFNAGLLGSAYLRLARYDSARYYFDWGLRQLPVRDLDNEAWVGIFNGNIGRVLVRQGQPDSARPYLRRGIAHLLRTQAQGNVALYGAQLATLFLQKNALDSAGYYARLAHRVARREGSPDFLAETHQVLRAYHERLGQTALALAHADSAARASEQWRAQRDVTLKHRAEVVLETERHQARERLLQREKDRQVLLRNGLLGFMALGAVLAWLLHNRRVLAERHRREQARAAQERSETELRLARAQLDQYLHSLREKNGLIERLSNELALATHPADPLRHEQLATLLRSVILTDADWQRFRHVFEQVHPRFFEHLRVTYPDLTPAEVRLLALSKLSLMPGDMGLMLGISTESLRKARYRLRRKLEQLHADEGLLGLIRPI